LIYFFLNGTVHFAQNYLAFAILSSTSPVTYSIASLVKRIAVICLAILWFNQAVHPVQAIGIGLTGIGLYMYNNAKRDVERGEKKVRHIEAVRDGILPLNKVDQRLLESSREGSPDIDTRGKGGVHASPKPTYIADQTPLSISTAVRGNGFSLPPPSFPLANSSTIDHLGVNSQHPPQVTMSMSISEPYPSPPPSNTSSPPFQFVSVPLKLDSATAPVTATSTSSYNSGGHHTPARRRLSNDHAHLAQPLGKPAATGALHQHLPSVSASPPATAAAS
jgi:solute carrier family 35, member E1